MPDQPKREGDDGKVSHLVLIATAFGFKAVIQRIDPPWRPLPLGILRLLGQRESHEKPVDGPTHTTGTR